MGVEKTLAVAFLLPAMWGGSLHETVAAQPGFEHFYNLRYDDALTAFQKQAADAPSLPDAYNHIAQTILYREMYRAGMLSSDFIGGTKFVHQPKVPINEQDDKQFHDALAHAFNLCQEKIAANPNDTAAMYSIGVSYGLRANYLFLVKKAWVDALKDATAARKVHRKVTELDPTFIDAELTQGVNDYVVGSLPLHWKLFGFMAGYRGDKQRGMRTLQDVAENGRLNRVDAMVLLSALYLREHQPANAVPVLTELTQTFPNNPLLRTELDKALAAEK